MCPLSYSVSTPLVIPQEPGLKLYHSRGDDRAPIHDMF
jgi:hypothetical protein